MHLLTTLWQRISEIGVYPDMTEHSIRRIGLLNRMNFILLSIILLSTVVDVFRGIIFESDTLLIFNLISSTIPIAVFLYVFFLVRKRKYFAAKTVWFVFMIFLGAIPTYLTINTGAGSEIFMIIVIPLLALLLYDDIRIIIGTFIYSLAGYLFIIWLNPEPLVVFPENEGYLILAFISITVFLLTYHLKLVNQKFENKLIEQKLAIEHQKNELNIKNNEITDSINYSRRLQDAVLPPKDLVTQSLPNSFILYKPKDIVSGDFYWFCKKSDNLLLIAAADSTGHGVPGAFTSLVCCQNLDDAVEQTTDPGEILSITNRGVKKIFRQEDNASMMKSGLRNLERVQEGMDIGLCTIDMEMGIVKYAGAKRPLIIIRNGKKEIEEIKGDRESIGGDVSPDYKYETHTIQLNAGDTMYIYSDGYPDQDGGEKGMRIMTKNFKHMLTEIQDMTMKAQEHYLEKFIDDYRGHREQVDDILVIGIKL